VRGRCSATTKARAESRKVPSASRTTAAADLGAHTALLQYLQVDCALPKDFVPDLPKCFFETKTPTLFCLDYALCSATTKARAESRKVPSASRTTAAADLGAHTALDACDFVNPLAQRLIARCVDVRKHIDKAVGSYVLPEVSSFIYTNFASNELCTIATL
jgi:hypothetical protein